MSANKINNNKKWEFTEETLNAFLEHIGARALDPEDFNSNDVIGVTGEVGSKQFVNLNYLFSLLDVNPADFEDDETLVKKTIEGKPVFVPGKAGQGSYQAKLGEITGANLITNSTFDNGDGWTLDTGVVIGSGILEWDTGAEDAFARTSVAWAVDKKYLLRYEIPDVSIDTGNSPAVSLGEFGQRVPLSDQVGKHSVILEEVEGDEDQQLFIWGTVRYALDNVYLYEYEEEVVSRNTSEEEISWSSPEVGLYQSNNFGATYANANTQVSVIDTACESKCSHWIAGGKVNVKVTDSSDAAIDKPVSINIGFND